MDPLASSHPSRNSKNTDRKRQHAKSPSHHQGPSASIKMSLSQSARSLSQSPALAASYAHRRLNTSVATDDALLSFGASIGSLKGPFSFTSATGSRKHPSLAEAALLSRKMSRKLAVAVVAALFVFSNAYLLYRLFSSSSQSDSRRGGKRGGEHYLYGDQQEEAEGKDSKAVMGDGGGDSYDASSLMPRSDETPLRNSFHIQSSALLRRAKETAFEALAALRFEELTDESGGGSSAQEHSHEMPFTTTAFRDCELLEREFGIRRCSTTTGEDSSGSAKKPHPLRPHDPSDPYEKGYLIVPGLTDPATVLAAYYTEQKRLQDFSPSSGKDVSADAGAEGVGVGKGAAHGRSFWGRALGENEEDADDEDEGDRPPAPAAPPQDGDDIGPNNERPTSTPFPSQTSEKEQRSIDQKRPSKRGAPRHSPAPLFPLTALEAFVELPANANANQVNGGGDSVQRRAPITIDIVYTYVDGDELSFLQDTDRLNARLWEGGKGQKSGSSTAGEREGEASPRLKRRFQRDFLSPIGKDGEAVEGTGRLTVGQTNALLAVWEAMLQETPALADLPTLAEHSREQQQQEIERERENIIGRGSGGEELRRVWKGQEEVGGHDTVAQQIATLATNQDVPRESERSRDGEVTGDMSPQMSSLLVARRPNATSTSNSTTTTLVAVEGNNSGSAGGHHSDDKHPEEKEDLAEEQQRKIDYFKAMQNRLAGRGDRGGNGRRRLLLQKNADASGTHGGAATSDANATLSTRQQQRASAVADASPFSSKKTDQHRRIVLDLLSAELDKMDKLKGALAKEAAALRLPLTYERFGGDNNNSSTVKRDLLFIRNAVKDGAGVFEHSDSSEPLPSIPSQPPHFEKADGKESGNCRKRKGTAAASRLFATASSDANRYRNFDELRHSLRSIYRHIVRPMLDMTPPQNKRRPVNGGDLSSPGAHSSNGDLYGFEASAVGNSSANGGLGGALRFSQRLGTVYIVVSNKAQAPAWLRTAAVASSATHSTSSSASTNAPPRIVLVEHKELFPSRSINSNDNGAASLPNFNSNAIESVIHRIPSLSRHYLYLNNDNIIARPVSFFDFFQPIVVGGAVRFLPQNHVGDIRKVHCTPKTGGGNENRRSGGGGNAERPVTDSPHELDYAAFRRRQKEQQQESRRRKNKEGGHDTAAGLSSAASVDEFGVEGAEMFRRTRMCVPQSLRMSDQEHLIFNTFLMGTAFKHAESLLATTTAANKNRAGEVMAAAPKRGFLFHNAAQQRRMKHEESIQFMRHAPFTLTNVHFPNMYDKYHILKMVTDPTIEPAVRRTRARPRRGADDVLMAYAYSYYSIWSSRFNEDIASAFRTLLAERSPLRELQQSPPAAVSTASTIVKDALGRRQQSLLSFVLSLHSQQQRAEKEKGAVAAPPSPPPLAAGSDASPLSVLFHQLSAELSDLMLVGLKQSGGDDRSKKAAAAPSDAHHHVQFFRSLRLGEGGGDEAFVLQNDLVSLHPLETLTSNGKEEGHSQLSSSLRWLSPSPEIIALWEESLSAAVGGARPVAKAGEHTPTKPPPILSFPLASVEKVEVNLNDPSNEKNGAQSVRALSTPRTGTAYHHRLVRHEGRPILLTHLSVSPSTLRFGSTEHWLSATAGALTAASGAINEEASPRYYFAMVADRRSGKRYADDVRPRLSSVLSVVFNDDLPAVANVPSPFLRNASQLLVAAACGSLSDYRLFQFIRNARGDFESVWEKVAAEERLRISASLKKINNETSFFQVGYGHATVSQSDATSEIDVRAGVTAKRKAMRRAVRGIVDKLPSTAAVEKGLSVEQHHPRRHEDPPEGSLYGEEGDAAEEKRKEEEEGRVADYADFIVASTFEKFKGMCKVSAVRASVEALRLAVDRVRALGRTDGSNGNNDFVSADINDRSAFLSAPDLPLIADVACAKSRGDDSLHVYGNAYIAEIVKEVAMGPKMGRHRGAIPPWEDPTSLG